MDTDFTELEARNFSTWTQIKANMLMIFMSISNSWTFMYREHICWGNMRRVIFDKQHKCSMPATISVLPITSRSVLISRLLEQTEDLKNMNQNFQRCVVLSISYLTGCTVEHKRRRVTQMELTVPILYSQWKWTEQRCFVNFRCSKTSTVLSVWLYSVQINSSVYYEMPKRTLTN